MEKNVLKNDFRSVVTKFVTKKVLMLAAVCLVAVSSTYAQDTAAGTAALTQVTSEIGKYVPIVQKLIYAIAGVVAVIGAISVYIKMNNEEVRQMCETILGRTIG